MIKNVCITTNVRVFLLYLLIQDEDSIDNTFFFFENCFPKEIRSNIPHYVVMTPPDKGRLSNIIFVLKVRFWKHFKYRFVRKCKIFGMDNNLITSPLIGDCKMTLLEDGLMNYKYNCPKTDSKLLTFLKKLLLGKILKPHYFGRSESVNRIVLTGLAPVPAEIQNKVELVDLNQLWISSSKKKKDNILKMFNVNDDVVNSFKQIHAVLFTQPFSEDGAFSEKDKVDLFGKIIGDMKIAIKPHPRETTNYSSFFPNTPVLTSYIPIELFSFLGIKFTEVYTVFSTAVLNFPYPVKVHFLGTQIHPALQKRFGNIKLENGEAVGSIFW